MMSPTITSPTLLLDQQKCLDNLDRMHAKCQSLGLGFRPHFKTHQSIEISRWFRARGVHKIATSSLKMAAYFAQDDWKDITVAFPTNILEIERINALATKVELNLLIQSSTVLQFLEDHLLAPINAFVKIDLGYGRTGFDTDDIGAIIQIVECIQASSKIHFKGFLGHAGHSYAVKGRAAIAQVHQQACHKMQTVYDYFSPSFPQLEISMGDTPTCSTMDEFACATELRPGNFIYYDLTQQQIGSCSMQQIAVAMACPVVAKHPKRNQLIIYGGGVHFSKESYTHTRYGPCYGLVVPATQKGWGEAIEGCYLAKLSQEHGTIQCTDAFMTQCQIGDIVHVLPVHSCMTANLLKQVLCSNDSMIPMMV